MLPVRNLPPGYTVVYPNRDKALSRATKGIVILILLVSVGLLPIAAALALLLLIVSVIAS